MVKRKKHDKDKYYTLAKQQGYRARSAFKLIQLNKKYDFLSKAKVCIDLCAAPGGWCQVAAKYMPVSSIILGIDLLPIRPIPNVKTYQCDITTQKCRQIIRQELQTWKADVVLCDGAPNVGAEYAKDAYVQNELALIALKLAVDVMGKNGIFVTKVFRSQDYNALLWVFKQLFKKVSATKPLSSRNESAEIFVVCEDYLAPHSIDPKLLDPKHVFSQIESQEKSITIFHPKYGQRKRHRDGYDGALGVTLTNKTSVSQFLDSTDPIRLLTDSTEISFTEDDSVFKDNNSTTQEIITCLKDLKVLGKADFKNLLKWRLKMIDFRNELLKAQNPVEEIVENVVVVDKVDEPMTQEEMDQSVNEELAQLQASLSSKKRRLKKKECLRKAKLRVRAAMGLDLDAIELPNTDGTFSLRELGISRSNLNNILEPNAQDAHVLGKISEKDNCSDEESWNDEDILSDSEAEYERQLEIQMDSLYDKFLSSKGEKEKAKRAVKRTKVAKRALASEALASDAAIYDGDASAYSQMINPQESSDESDQEDNPLIMKATDDSKPTEIVNRWFNNNPLFENLEENNDQSNDVTDDESSDEEEENSLYVDKEGDVLPVMPRTDKQVRKEKRKATVEKKERQLKRKQKSSEFDEKEESIQYIEEKKDEDKEISEIDAKDLARLEEKKKLIKAGIGKIALEDENNYTFEVVPAPILPVVDERKYDSDHEEYDLEDQARTLTIATMMLKKSKMKEMIDDSYNRYAWNDPEGLPDWFLDDEEKHFRPQIPISKEIMEQMKEKFMAMATKPVKKVAEARARKKRQQLKKLKVAKKKATEIANLPDMSTREKLKAINKAMKGAEMKKSNKVYVVSKRDGKTKNNGLNTKKGAKGKVKFVDPRMKTDKRNAEKKKKRGKKK